MVSVGLYIRGFLNVGERHRRSLSFCNCTSQTNEYSSVRNRNVHFFQDFDDNYEEALNTSWASSAQTRGCLFTHSSNFVDTDCKAGFCH